MLLGLPHQAGFALRAVCTLSLGAPLIWLYLRARRVVEARGPAS
ncbi:MAG: hypothetical protein AB7K71_15050 [Polyangiaceae bacterium]